MRFIRPLSGRTGRSLSSGPTHRVDIGWDKSSRIDAGFSSHRLAHATLALVAAQRFFLAADPHHHHHHPRSPVRAWRLSALSECRRRRRRDGARAEVRGHVFFIVLSGAA